MTAVALRCSNGSVEHAPHWVDHVDEAEWALLDRARTPILDVGCGPGRHVRALAEQGHYAIGIDVSRPAVLLARAQGSLALQRSVFDPLPAPARFATVLLLDGNVGIGGCAVTLFRRVAELLVAGGGLLIEVEGPNTTPAVDTVRLEIDGRAGPWFRWTRVGVDLLEDLAAQTGFVLVEYWQAGDRWFAELRRT